jgi:hypothetical protein
VHSLPNTPDLLVAADIAAAQGPAPALSIVIHGGDARILDTDLAKRLGFGLPREIRRLIARHGDTLSKMGPLPQVEEVVGKGQKANAYYLNRKQAIFITAKSETPRATDITIEIVERFDAYERGGAAGVRTLARPTAVKEVAATFRAYHGIARLAGLDRNQASLSAGRATKAVTGVDPLEALAIKHLVAPQQEAALTPSDLGARVGGKSAVAVNKILAQRGLQTSHRAAKGQQYWQPTAAGEPHAVWLDTGKRHSDGTPVRQLKWAASILPLIEGGAS